MTEARPIGFGLNMARPRRNLLLVAFEDRAFVGVPRKARGKSGNAVIDAAQVQEFGVSPLSTP